MLATNADSVAHDTTLDSLIGDRSRQSIDEISNLSTYENNHVNVLINDSGNFDITNGSFGQLSIQTMKPKLKIYIERYIEKS